MAAEKVTVATLIGWLREKDQTAEVEFVVVQPDGKVLAMLVEKQAKAIMKVLKLFGSA